MSNNSTDRVISFDLENGKTVRLELNQADFFNVDQIVSIDYGNIVGEYLTAPMIFNQIANLRSFLQEKFQRSKLNVKIVESQTRQFIRQNWAKLETGKSTSESVNDYVVQDEDFVKAQNEMIDCERLYNDIDSLYWSMKEKCSKLDKMFEKMNPKELDKDLIEGQINNVFIKIKKSAIS